MRTTSLGAMEGDIDSSSSFCLFREYAKSLKTNAIGLQERSVFNFADIGAIRSPFFKPVNNFTSILNVRSRAYICGHVKFCYIDPTGSFSLCTNAANDFKVAPPPPPPSPVFFFALYASTKNSVSCWGLLFLIFFPPITPPPLSSDCAAAAVVAFFICLSNIALHRSDDFFSSFVQCFLFRFTFNGWSAVSPKEGFVAAATFCNRASGSSSSSPLSRLPGNDLPFFLSFFFFFKNSFLRVLSEDEAVGGGGGGGSSLLFLCLWRADFSSSFFSASSVVVFVVSSGPSAFMASPCCRGGSVDNDVGFFLPSARAFMCSILLKLAGIPSSLDFFCFLDLFARSKSNEGSIFCRMHRCKVINGHAQTRNDSFPTCLLFCQCTKCTSFPFPLRFSPCHSAAGESLYSFYLFSTCALLPSMVQSLEKEIFKKLSHVDRKFDK